jgi:hypothetical protein
MDRTNVRYFNFCRWRRTVRRLLNTGRGKKRADLRCYCNRTFVEVLRGPTGRLRLKCDGTRAETRFRLSAKRTSPLKSAGASVQSTTGIRGVRISGSNAGYTMFRVSVKSPGYPLNSPVSPSLPLPCVTVCHHISSGLLNEDIRGSGRDSNRTPSEKTSCWS